MYGAAVDTEATGTDAIHGCKPFMITACDGVHNYCWEGVVDPYTREVTWEQSVLDEVQAFFNKCDWIVFHNANFDIRMLATINLYIGCTVHDTLIAYHLCYSGDPRKGLKPVCFKLFNYPEDDEDDLEIGVKAIRESNVHDYDIARQGHPHFPGLTNSSWYKGDYWLCMDLCRKYALGDVERTFALWKACGEYMLKFGLFDVYTRRIKLLPVFYKMQSRGMHVYQDRMTRLKAANEYQLEVLYERLQKAYGTWDRINPGSNIDIARLLHKVLKLPVTKRTDSGAAATDSDTIKEHYKETKHPALQTLLSWRKCNKEITDLTSWSNWLHEGKLHSNVNITGTIWARQSSSGPNQQNFNKHISFIFGPDDRHYHIYMDVVNIELRVWAYDADCKELINLFEQGISVHEMLGRVVYVDEIEQMGWDAFKETVFYTMCKSGTFALLYGGSPNKIDNTYGVRGAYGKIRHNFPELGYYLDKLTVQMYKLEEFYQYPTIFTADGYKLDVPRSQPHKVISARIQGFAARIVQEMMLEIDKDDIILANQGQMIQQVHDSIKTEFPVHTNAQTMKERCVLIAETTGEKFIPTCPMDADIIEWNPEYEFKCTDYTFQIEEHDGHKLSMYKTEIDYLCESTYNKESFTHRGNTAYEAYHEAMMFIDNTPF